MAPEVPGGLQARRRSSGAMPPPRRPQLPTADAQSLHVEPSAAEAMKLRLEAALRACPRKENEPKVRHARRLKAYAPELDVHALAEGTGARVVDLRKDPRLVAPTLSAQQRALLDAAKRAAPRPRSMPGDRISNIEYARRLAALKFGLSGAAIALGSGARLREIETDRTAHDPTAVAAPGPLSRSDEHAGVPDRHVRAQIRASELLANRMMEQGLTIEPNAGGGANLCLIMALLQHVDPPPVDLAAHAVSLRDELLADPELPDTLRRALGEGQGIHSDREALQLLASRVFGRRDEFPIVILQGGAQGVVQFFMPLADPGLPVEAASVPHRAITLLESPGHFEAVFNTSGRPWSSVLARLGSPPATQDAPSTAGERQVAIRLNRTATQRQTIPLVMGEQLALLPVRQSGWAADPATAGLALAASMAGSENVPKQVAVQLREDSVSAASATLAAEMAQGQDVVDDFWAALKEFGGSHLGSREMPDGQGSVHRLGVSPLDGYVETLSERAGHAGPAALEADETAHQYVGLLHVIDGRIVSLTVQSTGEGDIAVEYAREGAQAQALLAGSAQEMALNAALRAQDLSGWRRKIDRAFELKKYEPSLGIAALMKGSGATSSHLRQQPRFNPPALRAHQRLARLGAAKATPSLPGESRLDYARRLGGAHPELSDEAIAITSGVRLEFVRGDEDLQARKPGPSAPAGGSSSEPSLPRPED